MNSIIYESAVTGHRCEYVSHLMRYIINHAELHGRYTFVLPSEMNKILGTLCCTQAFSIKYMPRKKHHTNSILRSFYEWKFISQIINEATYSEIIFLDIDQFLFLLTIKRFKQADLSVKGILFQPYVHYKEQKDNLWFYFRHVIRSYAFQKLSTFLNPNIHKLFILNDKNCPHLMNKTIKNIFHFLPDPIDNKVTQIEPGIIQKTLAKYAINRNKKNLLLFGTIDERKNLINIINALLILPCELQKNIHLVVAGKLSKSSREKYISHINRYKHQISIVYKDEFVSDEERETLFQYCDLVLMPYVNFYSSSGILGHTIKHNKSVIVSKTGFISKIVHENNIGITVNPLNKFEIKDAILKWLQGRSMFQYNSQVLLQEYHPNRFSKTLLSI